MSAFCKCKKTLEKSVVIAVKELVTLSCSARKKTNHQVVALNAYKVGCAMPVKRLDAVETDNVKEEKYKDISQNKKKNSRDSKD